MRDQTWQPVLQCVAKFVGFSSSSIEATNQLKIAILFCMCVSCVEEGIYFHDIKFAFPGTLPNCKKKYKKVNVVEKFKSPLEKKPQTEIKLDLIRIYEIVLYT